MRNEVINGIKNLIKERERDLELLNLEWFGGEPLLAFDIIRDIMNFAQESANKNGFVLSSGMTT